MVHSYFRYAISKALYKAACLLLITIALTLTACGAKPNERELSFDTTVYLNQIPLQVVVFKTHEAQRLGLMGISYLPESAGGLFVFPAETDVHFWMKNVLIELDLLFFDQQGQLRHWVEAAQPCRAFNCPRFHAQNVKYVLELNGGFIKAHKLPELTHLQP